LTGYGGGKGKAKGQQALCVHTWGKAGRGEDKLQPWQGKRFKGAVLCRDTSTAAVRKTKMRRGQRSPRHAIQCGRRGRRDFQKTPWGKKEVTAQGGGRTWHPDLKEGGCKKKKGVFRPAETGGARSWGESSTWEWEPIGGRRGDRPSRWGREDFAGEKKGKVGGL